MVNLLDTAKKLSQTNNSWASEQIGNFNNSQVNVRFMHDTIAKWHIHPQTDEMFVVLSGLVIVDTEQDSFSLHPNDCFIVKAGTRHRARVNDSAMLMTMICKTSD